MKSGKPLDHIARELQRQLGTKLDLKAPTTLMTFRAAAAENRLAIELATGPAEYGTTELARRQLAEKLKIPYAYFQRMESQQRRLLEDNVNTWLHASEEERLVRILDGNVRAILSDRYRRLDNHELTNSILPILFRLPGARFVSCELTDTKLYLKVVAEETYFEIAKDDFIQAGVVVSNSEVGCGSLTVKPLVYRSGKRTGFIMPDSKLMKKHVGRILETEDEGFTVFKDDTLKADDMAFFKKVRDVVEYCVSQAMLNVVGEKMQRTLGISLIGNVRKVVEVLGQKHTLSESEQDGILKRLACGGDLSALGLVNAVTALSHDLADYDRATELEELSGHLLSAPAKDLAELVASE